MRLSYANSLLDSLQERRDLVEFVRWIIEDRMAPRVEAEVETRTDVVRRKYSRGSTALGLLKVYKNNVKFEDLEFSLFYLRSNAWER